MNICEAVKLAMKNQKTTQGQMAERIGVKGQSVIAQRLRMDNISVNTVLEMLDAIGYEMVIQEKRPGRRSEGQFVVTLEKRK
ncbi:helix-turn-helix domain-containing protein [Anaerofilum sp. BX8]|uniref:Helix-turn-helix domain-containing protein n=1 Tax=Anaerofilum hominis TaxID=2763016 RepID=A0A923REY5_9FIRM|nr:helix-turn-helix domain-containing protein [Anaerofilum hominis]MBC5582542.1 helix-turn-helix domain-containing protein [Anaerofilum hominis]